ncbi:MAG: DEDD exonuclease domain-containing protein [Acidimicrobiales bacterium]
MQRSFDDLGTPLRATTFCVLDIETTGGSAADGGITEIGAVRVRAGECLGTFQTFVNPGCAIPRQITMLTGITEAMVAPAPTPDQVMPTFGEFLGSAVIVGHNVRYDLGYLNGALVRAGRPQLANPVVDTLGLARRLVREEVPNCRLATLANRFRLAHRPSHRALSDALATADLLHLLIERAAAFGVCGLDDLIALPKLAAHPQAPKLRLTDHLPRQPGVYLFRDGGGRTLYVGKATDLRARVRSFFSGDDRRKVGQLLREVQRIDHVVCSSPLEAAVLEVRLLHRLEPRFNRQATTWRRYTYLKLTSERFPRLSVVRATRPDGSIYLGPMSSTRVARRVADAIETAVPLRRCTATPGRGPARSGPCAAAQLGVASCPCAGAISEAQYARHVDTVRRGMGAEPELLLAPLEAKMASLAAAERFEEAVEVRDRAAALAQALVRHRRFSVLRAAGRVVVELDGRSRAELRRGRLVKTWTVTAAGITAVPLPLDLDPAAPDHYGLGVGTSDTEAQPALDPLTDPLPKALADELSCVASWLDRQAHRLVVVHADADPLATGPPLPTFKPTPTGLSHR